MKKIFCDRCEVELTDENIMNFDNNISFKILDVERNGKKKVAHVLLQPLGSWDNFDICRKCALESMKKFIDEIDFSDKQNFKNK